MWTDIIAGGGPRLLARFCCVHEEQSGGVQVRSLQKTGGHKLRAGQGWASSEFVLRKYMNTRNLKL